MIIRVAMATKQSSALKTNASSQLAGNGGICFLALKGMDLPQSAFTDVGENKFHCIAYTASSKIMYHVCFHLDV